MKLNIISKLSATAVRLEVEKAPFNDSRVCVPVQKWKFLINNDKCC